MTPFIACPVCFGATDGALVTGSTMGIVALLLVTLAMLTAFGAFFLTLRRRAAAAAAQSVDSAPGLSPESRPC